MHACYKGRSARKDPHDQIPMTGIPHDHGYNDLAMEFHQFDWSSSLKDPPNQIPMTDNIKELRTGIAHVHNNNDLGLEFYQFDTKGHLRSFNHDTDMISTGLGCKIYPEMMEFTGDRTNDTCATMETVEMSPLLAASCDGDLQAVITLLASLSCASSTDETDCVIAACARGHADVVRMLLMSETCDPSAQKNLALHLAVMYAHPEVVEILLADSRVDPSEYVYLLGLACGENHDVRWLIDFMNCSYCPLDYHIGEGDLSARAKVVMMLVSDKRVLIPSQKQTWVSQGDNVGVWRPWREESALTGTWEDTQSSLLPWAAAHGSVELVHLLLADERFSPQAALCVAAGEGHLDMVRILRADPRVEKVLKDTFFCHNSGQAMRAAAGKGHIHVVTYFMSAQEQRMSPHCVKQAIESASSGGHIDVVNVLLESESNPDASKEGYLQGAFFAAASHGQLELMVSLIARDEQLLQNGYQRALAAAAKANHPDTVHFLMKSIYARNGSDDHESFNDFLNDTFAEAASLFNVPVLKCINSNKRFYMFKSVYNKAVQHARRKLKREQDQWEMRFTRPENRHGDGSGSNGRSKWTNDDVHRWKTMKAHKLADMKKITNLLDFLKPEGSSLDLY